MKNKTLFTLLPHPKTGKILIRELLSGFEQGDQEEMSMAAEPKPEYR